jgi:ABC-type dipeptide/oligopeptide/nickel transport system permease component
VLHGDYIRTARAKGLSELRVLRGHALRNALLPVVTVIGLQLGFSLGGTVIIENIFAYPGVGNLIVSSINQRDYTIVQGGVLLLATGFVLINLVVDLIYGYIDPRVKHG